MSSELSSQVKPPAFQPARPHGGGSTSSAPVQVGDPEGKAVAAAKPNTGTQNSKAAEAAERVEKAVQDIRDFVQDTRRGLNFSVDEKVNRTVVKVIDLENNEVVRQIPREEILDIARSLHDLTEEQAKGLLLKEKA